MRGHFSSSAEVLFNEARWKTIRREVCYNLGMELTERQQAIIIGSILGDGGVYFNTNSPRAYYMVKQSLRYSEYVDWLFSQLKNLCPSEVKQRKDNGQKYFYTSPNECLNIFQELFYRNKIKRVPENIDEILISPLSIAVWFMDDGTLDFRPKDHCAFHLCTNCFSKEDTQRLIETLKKNFGIECSLHYTLCRGKRHARIYIGSKGRDEFIKLISPYILSCFKYKLPQFRHTPQRLDHFMVG